MEGVQLRDAGIPGAAVIRDVQQADAAVVVAEEIKSYKLTNQKAIRIPQNVSHILPAVSEVRK